MFLADYKKHKSAKLERYLLWDLPIERRISWIAWRDLIISRVVERGDLEDWYFILNKYGLETVRQEVLKETWSIYHKGLLSVMLGIPLNEIKCYIQKPFQKPRSR